MDIKEIFDKLRDEVRKLLGDPRSNNVDHAAVHAAIDKAHEAATDTKAPESAPVAATTATVEQSGSGAAPTAE